MSEIRLQGIGASEGIAIGPIFRYEPPDLRIPERAMGSPASEMQRFDAAVKQAQAELAELKAKVAERAEPESAAIFDAHSMIAADSMLRNEVARFVEDGGRPVEAAVMAVTDALAAQFAAMADEYFAERATDMRDVGRRLVRVLLGAEESSLNMLDQPAIIAANDLSPSDTAGLDAKLALGLVTAMGGLTSHTAILARTLGLPAVVGLGVEAYRQIAGAESAVLDGAKGTVIFNPSAETVKQHEDARAQRAVFMEMVQARAGEPAHTADGRRVEVAANIGDLDSAKEAVKFGAEGVGLLRTEFLYLEDTRPPSEEKQVCIYKDIFEAMGGRPVIVRTLDIGGDKPPSFLDFGQEMNPFLGWRALRICLDDVALFKTQLRAILRAADGHNALIMYPMVINVTELQQTRDILEECKAELRREGQAFNDAVPTGIMVETPAAAINADLLAPYVDFFSIGANDLTQYTLAVDRTNEKVAHLYNSLDPAVLRLVRLTIEASHAAGKWTGMCGEMAGQKLAIPILLGLGLDEFSMVARAIPEAKFLIGKLSDADAQAIAAHAMTLDTAQAVEAYMSGVLRDLGM